MARDTLTARPPEGTVTGMNLCPRGHDKDAVGVTTKHRCRECHREDRRAYRQAHKKGCSHPGECETQRVSTGALVCLTRLRVQAAATRRAQPEELDGWEDEFGPLDTSPVGVDWVAEARLAAERPPVREERPLRPRSVSVGAVGSAYRGPGHHPAMQGTRRAVYGFIGA